MAVPQRPRTERASRASDDALRPGQPVSRAATAATGQRAAKTGANAARSKSQAAGASAAQSQAGGRAGKAKAAATPAETKRVPRAAKPSGTPASSSASATAAKPQAPRARKPATAHLPSFADLKQAFTQPAEAMAANFAKALPGVAATVPGLGALKAGAASAEVFKLPGLPAWPGAVSAPLGLGDAVAPLQQAAQAMGQSLGATLQSLAGLSVPSDELKRIQQDYVQQATALWNQAIGKASPLKPADRRFAAPAWTSNPSSAFTASLYLLNAQTLTRLADSLEGDDKARERVRFSVQQWVDAASPSNFLALNPEALQKAVETKGNSITQGVQHLLHDLRQGHLSQTDESVFHVGQNVANTPGTVVFENAFFQLIEYAPLTPKVHERPFLFVPPCINKFYILDLQPDNSLVRYAVSQGHRVFMVSWVNADESLAKATWDDYTEQGVMEAIRVTREITGAEQVNALGFCVGGTLLSAALATLAARGEKPVASLTLLTTYLDFANTGIMDIFVDEASVRSRELTLGPNSPQGGGLMKGGDLAATFSFLRANDLVWNYVVGNYLKGEMPPAFDLLYWNSDSTNLPGPMYAWYLRNTYLENKLVKPGAVSVCGKPLDLGLLDMPTFIYGSREDHIVPWDSAYASTHVVSGPKTFVLGASGHIAGVINPPEKKKRSHWVSPAGAKGFPDSVQRWMDTAEERPGSWWPVWSDWLKGHAGKLVPAPTAQGSRAHPPIEAAPGRYVLRKA
jgi:polyhydroxyalkanoate synthase